MAGFIYKLQNIINTTYTNEDNNVNIARCLLKNINSFNKKTSLDDFADICFTSQSSITRFIKKIGYQSFNDFKADCLGVQTELQEMIIDNKATNDIDVHRYAKNISDCLISMQDTFSIDKVDELCEYIHEAHRIIIFATHIPGDMASIIQRAILTTGKYIEFYPRKEHQIEVIQQITKNDLCIFISLEGTLLMEKSITIPAIVSQAITVLITQSPHIKFSEQITQVFSLGNHDEENVGKFKLLFFIDCLLNHYYRKYIVNQKDGAS